MGGGGKKGPKGGKKGEGKKGLGKGDVIAPRPPAAVDPKAPAPLVAPPKAPAPPASPTPLKMHQVLLTTYDGFFGGNFVVQIPTGIYNLLVGLDAGLVCNVMAQSIIRAHYGTNLESCAIGTLPLLKMKVHYSSTFKKIFFFNVLYSFGSD